MDEGESAPASNPPLPEREAAGEVYRTIAPASWDAASGTLRSAAFPRSPFSVSLARLLADHVDEARPLAIRLIVQEGHFAGGTNRGVLRLDIREMIGIGFDTFAERTEGEHASHGHVREQGICQEATLSRGKRRRLAKLAGNLILHRPGTSSA